MTRLLADVGGTSTRFCLDDGTRFAGWRVVRNDDHPDLAAAIHAYLGDIDATAIEVAGLAVAAPVRGDTVTLTNRAWSFATRELAAGIDARRIEVVNDFAANAMGIPFLPPRHLRPLGGGPVVVAARPLAILGPGTGLGVSTLVPCSDGWAALSGEGGHVTLAAADDEQARLIGNLRRTHGHVSAERLLSGPGLVELYRAVCADSGAEAVWDRPELITAARDPAAVHALQLFLDFLGNVAGNLALSVGSLGGVYLAGGILPRIRARLDASRFRHRFLDKGRFRGYLEAIPVFLVTSDRLPFFGLRALLDGRARAV